MFKRVAALLPRTEEPFKYIANHKNPFTLAKHSKQESYANTSTYYKSLGAFFELPKVEKKDAEDIFNELKQDMEDSMTPSKLVGQLDKHIISQTKAKRVIA